MQKKIAQILGFGILIGTIINIYTYYKPASPIYLMLFILTVIPIVTKISLDVGILHSTILSWVLILIRGLGSSISAFFLKHFFGIETNMILKSVKNSMLFDALPFFLMTFTIIIVSKTRIKNSSIVMKGIEKYKDILTYILLLCITALIVNYQIFYSHFKSDIRDYISEIIILILIYVHLVIYNKNSKLENENRHLRNMMVSNEGAYIIYKKLKHNYLNTIASIKGFCDNREYEKLRNYLDEIMEYADFVNQSTFIEINKIKNYALYGLIGSKIAITSEKNIKLKLRVFTEIDFINMRNKDLIEVVGNFLDNAIEAANDSTEKVLIVEIIEENDFVSISIKNSYNGELDLGIIKEKGTSSRGRNRGYGLWICNRILETYANVLNNTEIEGKEMKYFKQELIIYNK